MKGSCHSRILHTSTSVTLQTSPSGRVLDDGSQEILRMFTQICEQHMVTTSLSKMGLKDFWRFLDSRCQRAKASRLPRVDGLFIDIAQFTARSYGPDAVTPEGFLTPKFYDDVIAEIKKTVSWIKPGSVVYIGKDGLEPTAKLGTTRERLKGKQKTPLAVEVIKPTGPHSRDQNLRDRISLLKENDRHWRNLEVIYDPRSSPGEAEVKFLQYLRNDESAARMSWCVYSNDSDFVPLLLALHRHNLWVRPFKDANWNIDLIHAEIAAMFDGSNESVDDFIALMSLVGNDFLPRITGIDEAVSAYQTITGHLVVNGDIDPMVLKALLRKLGEKSSTETKRDEVEVKRSEAMADAYLHGIRWFTHLYLGGLCDWYWSYIFSKPPQIGMMLNRIDAIDMCRDSIPKEYFDPSELVDIHIAKALPPERVDEFHDKLVGNSMDEIYSSDPETRRDEMFRKLVTSLESARVIAKELDEARVDIVPGGVWISGRNETSFRTIVIPWEPRFPSDVKDP